MARIILTPFQLYIFQVLEFKNPDIYASDIDDTDDIEIHRLFVRHFDGYRIFIPREEVEAYKILSFITGRINALDSEPYRDWSREIKSLNGLCSKISAQFK